jgi:putative transposase
MPSRLVDSTYFFTLYAAARNKDLLTRYGDILRNSIQVVAETHPFKILAMVVLPDHLHCIMAFPDGDEDYCQRWKLIQKEFAEHLSKYEFLSRSRLRRRERGVWQRQYKSYKLHTDIELRYGMAYIRRDPIKHGLVNHEQDWPHVSGQSLAANPRRVVRHNKNE